jgi:MGT family glycosyltransferase
MTKRTHAGRTYLATLVDGGGTVSPELGAVDRLTRRGNRVVVLAEDTMAAEVRAAGGEFVPWSQAPNRASRRPEDDPYRDWECKNPRQLFERLMEKQFVGPAPAYAADTSRAVAEHRPEAVISSIFAVGAMVAAQGERLPLAVLVPNVYPLPTAGLPPFASGLAPARTPLGRVAHAILRQLVERMFDRKLAHLNALRESYSLPPLRHFWDQVRSADQQLVLTSRAFDLPANHPNNVRYVGAVLDDPLWAEPWTPPEGEEPLVLVGMSSTYMEQQSSLQAVADALGTLPVRGLVTTGPALDPEVITAPANVTVVASAPHGQVLKHAHAVVTHGGHGTVMKTLAAGVPMVVMPHGRDQKDNGVRIRAHGAGLVLPRNASSRRIATALQRVLDDSSFTDNARSLGTVIYRDAHTDDLLTALQDLPRPALHKQQA